jgi:hypothetical protein
MNKPIIDNELFSYINQVTPLKFHKREKKIDRVFLLKGVVRCDVHNCAMTPYFIMKKTGPVYYYMCTKKRQYKGLECSVAYANADKLENYVIERLKEVSNQKPVFESIINQVNMNLSEEMLPFQEELKKTNQ